MTHRIARIGIVLGFFVLGTSHTLAQNSPPPLAGFDGDLLGDGDTATGNNWACVQLSSCPSGLILMDPTGNHVGCFVLVPDSVCGGSCKSCEGATGSVRVCEAQPGATCVATGTHSSRGCGRTFIHEHGCKSSQPAGFPTTPNGCYCHTEYGGAYDIFGCTVVDCVY